MKRASIIAGAVAVAFLLSSCDVLLNMIDPAQKLEISIASNKTGYEYNEKILVSLTAVYEEGRSLSISWTLNGQALVVDNPKNFSLYLKPEATTTYTLKATVNDGITTVTKEMQVTVKAFALSGTWKATNEENPGYVSNVDIIGIWTANHFEMYYYTANGGTVLKTYSARGSIEFVHDSAWITLTQDKYYDASTTSWKDWTYDSGIMWVRYTIIDATHVRIELDRTSPAGTAEYTWDFTKQSDSVVPLH